MSILQNLIISNFMAVSLSIFLLWVYYIFFNKRYSNEKMIKYVIALVILMSLGFYGEKYFANSPVKNFVAPLKIVFNFGGIVLCTRIILKIRYFEILLSLLLLFVLNTISNCLVVFMLSSLGISVSEAKNSFFMFFIVYCLIDFTTYLILFIFNFVRIVKKVYIPSEIKYQYLKKLIPNLIIILCFILINTYTRDQGNGTVMNPKTVFINLLFLVLFFILSINNFNSVIRLSTKANELDLQNIYNEKLQSFIDEMERVKGNFNNIIATINGYLKFEEWEKLESYYEEIKLDSISINSIQSIISLDITSPALFGLIASKMELAARNNLHFDMRVSEKIEDFSVSIYTLCDILGCLMDNAIEAASESKNKFLSMKIGKADGNLCFKLENSYKEKPNINFIYQKGISSKGEGRGNGLNYVRSKVDKEDNLILNTIIENNTFVQELILLNEYIREDDMKIVLSFSE